MDYISYLSDGALVKDPWEQAFDDLAPYGNAFRERLQHYMERPPSKQRRELPAFRRRIETGKYAAGLSDGQRVLALHMVDLCINNIPVKGNPGRKPGPVTDHARIYAAAIERGPLYLMKEHIREIAPKEAERLADDVSFCARSGLSDFPRQRRVGIITSEIKAAAPRLAQEYLDAQPKIRKGEAGPPAITRGLMELWRDMPEVPEYLRRAAHPQLLEANEKARAQRKSRNSDRQTQATS